MGLLQAFFFITEPSKLLSRANRGSTRHRYVYLGSQGDLCLNILLSGSRQSATQRLRSFQGVESTLFMPFIHRCLSDTLGSSKLTLVSLGEQNQVGIPLVRVAEKFHQSQENVWEEGGLPEGENKAPEEGIKSTKKPTFFHITGRKQKVLGHHESLLSGDSFW